MRPGGNVPQADLPPEAKPFLSRKCRKMVGEPFASGEFALELDVGGSRARLTAAVGSSQQPNVRALVEVIPEAEWTEIPYWLKGGAAVAETSYTPFAHEPGGGALRLIVRRVRPTPGSQLALFATYSYHAFITDRAGELLELEADHRRHAEVENAFRDLKYGVGLNHLPSGRFAANAAWLAVQVIAHNLARWTARLGLGADVVTTKTLRRRCFALAGRLTRSARRWTLHLPGRWPWSSRARALTGAPAPGLTPAHSAGPRPGLAPACPRTPRAPPHPRPQRPRATLGDDSRRRPAPGSAPPAPARARLRPASAGALVERSGSPQARPVSLRSVDLGLGLAPSLLSVPRAHRAGCSSAGFRSMSASVDAKCTASDVASMTAVRACSGANTPE